MHIIWILTLSRRQTDGRTYTSVGAAWCLVRRAGVEEGAGSRREERGERREERGEFNEFGCAILHIQSQYISPG